MSKLCFVLQARVLLKNSVQLIKQWLNWWSDFSNDIQKCFLFQVTEGPTRRGAMLNLVLTNKEGLVWNMKLGRSLGFSDLGAVEFDDLGAAGRSAAGSVP